MSSILKSKKLKSAQLFFDGGCYPNPGQMDIALVFCGGYNNELYQELTQGTNNLAEWYALLSGLEIAINEGIDHLEVIGDSELVIHQINGKYKVKKASLKPLYEKCNYLKSKFKKITFTHVKRDNNLAGVYLEQMRPEKS